MAERGLSATAMAKIARANFLRVLRETEARAASSVRV
jgi:hypothetical protein